MTVRELKSIIDNLPESDLDFQMYLEVKLPGFGGDLMEYDISSIEKKKVETYGIPGTPPEPERGYYLIKCKD